MPAILARVLRHMSGVLGPPVGEDVERLLEHEDERGVVHDPHAFDVSRLAAEVFRRENVA